MLDFTAALSPELARTLAYEREAQLHGQRWYRQLRQLDVSSPQPARISRIRLKGAAARRRALFAEGLDAAQREGITVDAWFGYRFADPELSARAEWAGLVEGGTRNRKDAWAA